MSVVKSTEHSRGTEEVTLLAGSLGERRNVAPMFLSEMALPGHFFCAQMSDQPSKG